MTLTQRALACLVALGLAACKSGTDGPTPTDLVVTPSPVPLTSINQTQQLTVVVKDQNDATMSGFTPTFTSTATSVATVSSSGLVTAVAAGSATIQVGAAGLSENVAVTVSQVPASITKTGGDGQSGLESSQLSTALKVKVADALGTGVAGVTVTFTVSGGGTLNDSSVTTDAAGEAQVTWTLGPFGQSQSVTATAGSLSTMFTATAQSASALTIAKFVGDNQTALVGYATNIRPAVRITNAATQAVQGVNVTFAVTGGGGSVSGSATVATNANGVAQVAGWTVGGSAGTNTLSATGSGTFSGSNSVTFTATGQTAAYNIQIRRVTGTPAFSAPVQAALDAAEAYWEQIIYGDLSNVAISTTNACGLGETINETVDDLIILAKFDAIDGAGGTLGRAGACSIRVSNGLTIYGSMVFDTADVGTMSTGVLNSVILHEMGHIIGFSDGIWNSEDGVTSPVTCAVNVPRESTSPFNGTAGLDSYFQCSGARAAFDSIGGGSFTGGSKVPIENCTGLPPGTQCSLSGTIYSHWRESVFASELMTGYVCSGGNCPLSTLTIASFGDIGYTVNYAVAQAYSQTFSARAAAGPRIPYGDDLLRVPLEIVDEATGRVVRVIRR